MRKSIVALTSLALVVVSGCTPSTPRPPSATSPARASRSPQTAHPSAPAAGGGLRVTGISVRADPFQVTSVCPVTITFSARISVAGGAGPVKYQWLRSDSAVAPVQEVTFEGPGQQDVVETWTLGGPDLPSYTGWQAVQILSPSRLTSERANFTLTCH